MGNSFKSFKPVLLFSYIIVNILIWSWSPITLSMYTDSFAFKNRTNSYLECSQHRSEALSSELRVSFKKIQKFKLVLKAAWKRFIAFIVGMKKGLSDEKHCLDPY